MWCSNNYFEIHLSSFPISKVSWSWHFAPAVDITYSAPINLIWSVLSCKKAHLPPFPSNVPTKHLPDLFGGYDSPLWCTRRSRDQNVTFYSTVASFCRRRTRKMFWWNDCKQSAWMIGYLAWDWILVTWLHVVEFQIHRSWFVNSMIFHEKTCSKLFKTAKPFFKKLSCL